eukprot:TRINITY_DN15541_c0_g1_i1.p1 TRINITY_DN15541_c0_g1~~TRINITY_DN15541_c0_g1_i1.p1  ORF type:complete len:318 (+),score=72.67 TRINITY_DN15541_c0_g1_i1:43-996(+)
MSHSTISLKGGDTTPSLLYNNLTMLDNWVAYVHKNDAVVVNISKHDAPVIVHPLQGLEGKVKATVYQVKAVDIGDVPTLLIVTQNGLLFWDMAKEKLLGSCVVEDSKEIFLSRGVVVVPQGDSSLIFLGHSNGSISVICYDATGQASIIKSLTKHTDSISDIAAGQVDGNFIISSADISGEMVVWSDSLEVLATASFPGDTVTSMQIFSSFIAASFGSGMIRLYNSHDCTVAVEIAAHARWINAMHYNPNTNLLASVSEDMLLCFWQMPSKSNGGKVQLHSHELLKDCLLTGVRLEDGVAYVTAYDWDKLYVVPVKA